MRINKLDINLLVILHYQIYKDKIQLLLKNGIII